MTRDWEILEEFRKKKNYSKKSWNNRRKVFRNFVEFLHHKGKNLLQVTFEDVYQYVYRDHPYLKKLISKRKLSAHEKMSPSTRATIVNMIFPLMRYLNEQHGLDKKEFQKIEEFLMVYGRAQKKLVLSKDRVLSDEELELIFKRYSASTALKFLIWFVYTFALRRSDILDNRIKVEDVNLQDLVLMIRKGKGGKAARIPITEKQARIIRRYLEYRNRLSSMIKHDELLTWPDGTRITKKKIQIITDEIKKIVPWFHFHALRVKRLTRLAEQGLEPYMLKIISRHSDFNTTFKYYIRVEDEKIRKKIDESEE